MVEAYPNNNQLKHLVVPVEIKGSPREVAERQRRRGKRIWLPKRVRKHPKMKRIFGVKRERNPRDFVRPQWHRRVPRRDRRRFNHIVEQAYNHGKL